MRRLRAVHVSRSVSLIKINDVVIDVGAPLQHNTVISISVLM